MSAPLAPADRVVVVGAGHAGVTLAASLREGGFAGPVTVLGDEDLLPYQRPPVSKQLLVGPDATPLPLRGREFYDDAHVTLHRGRGAVDIDRVARVVRTADGVEHAYDHLVLATGSRPRTLELPGWAAVQRLHTPADAARVRAGLGSAGSLLVVGAGFIGLELAAAARAQGVPTTVVTADHRAMARSLTTVASDHAARVHAGSGTTIVWGAEITGLLREGDRVVGVTLAGGEELRAGLVVAGVGSVPNDELAARCGLPVAGGVVVDATLATPDPRVSAIGDCARFTSTWATGTVRLECVQNAVDHARHVAHRLLTGDDSPYARVPWFWSVQGSMRLSIAGVPTPDAEVVRRGEPGAGAFSLYAFEGERLVSVESFNRPAEHLAARTILSGGVLPSREDVADLDVDLLAVARARTT